MMREPNPSHIQPAQVTTYHVTDDGYILNNPSLAFLVYQAASALPQDDPASICEAVFSTNG